MHAAIMMMMMRVMMMMMMMMMSIICHQWEVEEDRGRSRDILAGCSRLWQKIKRWMNLRGPGPDQGCRATQLFLTSYGT